ncbi:hypothetical protein [Emticicia sp. SJ17W-69]|uniref:hypothetical protein n=1 Tax=Emticicia sp. SJ17W-69 TaxID=3421657 RepID=UPI003EBD2C9B
MLYRSLAKNIFSFFIILIPIVIFGVIFNKYAINIPHWDDFAVRNSLLSYYDTDSFIEKIKILFAQHNEHRIFLTRLLALLIYKVEGTLDLKSLMFLGNLSLVGILYLFYKISEKYNYSIISIVPISFLIFTSALYENTFWGMASIQNFGVIFFAFLTFYWLTFSIEKTKSYYFYFAIFSCFLGVFTSYNGIIIPVIGLLILLFQQRKSAIFKWSIACFILLMSYFYDFVKNPEKTSETDFSHPQLLLKGFFATIGNVIDSSFISPNKQTDLSITLGVFLVCFIVIFSYQVVFKKYNLESKTNDLFLLACLTFLVITCIGIVLARISFGFGTLLTSKYKIYSILVLSIFYLAALQSVSESRKTSFISVLILGSIFLNFYTYIADYQKIINLRHERITDQFKQQYSDHDFPVGGLSLALQQPAKTFYDDIGNKVLQASDSVKTNISIIENETSFRLEEKQNGKILDFSSADAGLFFILKSPQKVYLFPSQTVPINRKAYLNSKFLLENRLPIGSFVAEITKFYIQSGKYQIGKILVENNSKTVIFTNQSIDIQSVAKEKPKQNW